MKNEKYKKLVKYMCELKNCVVAFSGGVDSSFLIKVAKDVLGDKALALTVVSPYIPKWEIEEAKNIAALIGIKHEFLRISEIPDIIKFNPANRCYLCKTSIFTRIREISFKYGFEHVVDGTNADDVKDYRPGLKALKELDIKSPLLENNITKEEIRTFSKKLNLGTWDKPSYACLLSRIPYGKEIKTQELERVEKSEKYLMSLGFKSVRVRSHDDLARIEVPENNMPEIIENKMFEKIAKTLRNFGFKYVTMDMEGYRMGSLNEEL
ncbi:ATP-dependent sacrificial sulfur transferase LarE [Clostridium autoethanogenum]|nr:NAD synthase [Clostridium autoethanogenum DSM 10061]OVY50546.1 NAD synthase [Clostridium autoethanogenum]